MYTRRVLVFFLLSFTIIRLPAQLGRITGTVSDNSGPLKNAPIHLQSTNKVVFTDSLGHFIVDSLPTSKQYITIHWSGYKRIDTTALLDLSNHAHINLFLTKELTFAEDVVITGTMKEVSRLESSIPVEVYTQKLFQKNPTPNLFESVGMINGVKPQLNCSVCNTGDIHINGMEGPYTMILIDGMPIVSALSSVYGLSGIPNSIIDRMEVVKGPASSLYGSDAMGGIINVITKNPKLAPVFSSDILLTTWGELNLDAAAKWNAGQKTSALVSVNYFNYQNPIDKNKDGFTDVTLQNRFTIFNKWTMEQRHQRRASIATRYVFEDRWGGQLNWSKQWRGSDSIYGESIYTNRFELIGLYPLPIKENVTFQFSYNWHNQNSYYGKTPFMAKQHVGFVQLFWDKTVFKKHALLMGAAFRFTYYDDNTTATTANNGKSNKPMKTPLPGIFVQEEWSISPMHKLLAGYRFDYDVIHKGIHSPRVAYKFSSSKKHTLRLSFGTGFRVVNLFTEDHAALTGSRDVVLAEKLNPERSYNGNLNYVLKIPTKTVLFTADITGFYSYFTNKIIGDYDSDPNKIIYSNINGDAVSRGLSLNIEATFQFPLKLMAGVTYTDVFQNRKDSTGRTKKIIQNHAPKWSGTFAISYALPKGFAIDFTGQWNGPMGLPILANDYRPPYSPWFCIANLQISKKLNYGFELYGGIKNLFNFSPKNPIMRAFDPFDKQVNDPVNNPNKYTFDTNYNYASMQGIRGFLGLRYTMPK
jgi:outer membrane receptor for ferrienterochelin and colicins